MNTVTVTTAGRDQGLDRQSPIFRLPGIADAGKVRLGAQGPIFRLPAIVDTGTVRLGAQGPIFR